MKAKAFIQNHLEGKSTVTALVSTHQKTEANEFFGLYAYATQSGAAAFDLAVGDDFWTHTPSKWLFGLDYGRTHPQALQYIRDKPNTEVRIQDGAWIIDKLGFMPRRDYHAKTAFFTNTDKGKFGLVSGSGNFSSNGLRKSIEAGVVLNAKNVDEYSKTISDARTAADLLWDAATPAIDILEAYEAGWSAAQHQPDAELAPAAPLQEAAKAFWIEAGYITRNRGPVLPGNQIDFPRGISAYFGFDVPQDLARNSVIGPITFEPPIGDTVTRNLRLGNNLMEKVSLPIPETHGFDIYDGKVLVFEKSGDRFRMRALELDDFETAFGDKVSGVMAMASGRRYGLIE